MNEDSFHSVRELWEGKPMRAERRHLVYLFGCWWEGPIEHWPRGRDLYRTEFLNSMEFCLWSVEFRQQTSGNLMNSGDFGTPERINKGLSEEKRRKE